MIEIDRHYLFVYFQDSPRQFLAGLVGQRYGSSRQQKFLRPFSVYYESAFGYGNHNFFLDWAIGILVIESEPEGISFYFPGLLTFEFRKYLACSFE